MSETRTLTLRSILISYAVALLAAALITFMIENPWQNDTFRFFFSEDGIFENLTVLLYLVTCLLVWRDSQVAISVRVALILFCLFLVSRELDFHTRFTEASLLRTDFYFTDEQPLRERLFFGAILGGIGVYGVMALWPYRTAFLRSLWRREKAAILVTIGFLFLPLSKSLDGRARDWREPFGIGEPPPAIRDVLAVTEEMLELLAPISFILAALFLLQRAMQNVGSPATESTMRPS